MGLSIQVTPLPDSSIRPSLGHIGLGLSLQPTVICGQLVAVSKIAHYVEEPVAHATRKVGHLALAAFRHVTTLTVVFNVHMLVGLALAAQVAGVAPASMLVNCAVRGPGFIVIRAHFATRFCLHWAFRDAFTNANVFSVWYTNSAGSTDYFSANV